MGRRSRREAKGARGFTLIEVVIALAILGIGLTVILELFSGGLRLARTSAEYTRAVNYARTKLEEITSQESIEEGVTEGELEAPFRWQVEVKKLDILPAERSTEYKPPVDLFQIKVNILWNSGSKERTTGLESYRTAKPPEEKKI